MPGRSLICALALCGLAAAVPARADDFSAEAVQFFEAKVRPILATHCLKCHGPQKQQAGLRLDRREAVLAGGDSGPAVVPHKPDESLLIEAVRHTGDIKMPPDSKLPDEAIAALTKWVEAGAPWPAERIQRIVPTSPEGIAQLRQQHWAFRPIARPAPPPVQNAGWVRNDVDRFILAKLEAAGLSPSPAADKRTLLRRVTFDLIGLPPTPAELAAFEADSSPEAFAKVVDRLLDSPHYGERWARYWLDVARYADNKGYVFFMDGNFPWAWTYRDYVIRAFNEDLPYNRFLLEQLAADQLDLGTDKRPLAAMGYLTLGGRFMNNVHDILDDRIDVVTRGLLGMTVGCARCHDHKYDPIPTADYYSLYGVFASSVEPEVQPLFLPPPDTNEYRRFGWELALRESRLEEFRLAGYRRIVNECRTRIDEYLLSANERRTKPDTEQFMLLADGGDINPQMIHRWEVLLARSRKAGEPVFAAWHALADLSPENFAMQAAATLERLSAEADPARRSNPLVLEALRQHPPATLQAAAQEYGRLFRELEAEWQKLLVEAVARKREPPVALPEPAREELRQVLYGPDAPSAIAFEQLSDLEIFKDRASQAVLQDLRGKMNAVLNGGGSPPRAMTLVDNAYPLDPRVFKRGSPANLGDHVPRQFLIAIAGDQRRPFAKGSGRLELAQAIVDPANPLTARVLVNRVWQHHFGTGLVRTPSDFGTRSDPPSHPELLDHLASTFMDQGWSIKKLHRAIVLSAAYQQQSLDRPEAAQIDPENRLLWRANRTRLDFEALRDAFLASAGALSRQVGGPSVNVFADTSRRTVYAYVDRLNLPGLFRTFDFPSPDATSPSRDQTTVAPQALYLMNDAFSWQAAQALLVKREEVSRATDPKEKVLAIYRVLFLRDPTPEEQQLAEQYLSGATPTQWQRFVQALLLTNEFAFVD